MAMLPSLALRSGSPLFRQELFLRERELGIDFDVDTDLAVFVPRDIDTCRLKPFGPILAAWWRERRWTLFAPSNCLMGVYSPGPGISSAIGSWSTNRSASKINVSNL